MEFSSADPTLLATSTRTAGVIRLWKIPTDISPQPVGRPVDAAAIYLAAHERRVDVMRDGTVRLWDSETMQERTCFEVPAEAVPQALSFDYAGEALSVAGGDGTVHVFDPRAPAKAVQTAISSHVSTKPIRLAWLTPDKLIATTGFSRQGGLRELALWDVSNLHTPLMQFPVEGSGVGFLQPMWDAALPVLYCSSKGEGLRIFELANGELSTEMKVAGNEKQATAIDMLPKSHVNPRKCEIARFIRLGTDNSIETTSVHVPRANGETRFQEDLYPPVPVPNPVASAASYFEGKPIEPLMVDMVEPPTFPPLAKGEDSAADEVAHLLLTPEAAPTVEELFERHQTVLQRESKVLLRRQTTISRTEDKAATMTGKMGAAESGAVPGIYKTGVALLEKRNWIGISSWEPHFLSLKHTKLYVFVKEGDEAPECALSCALLKKVDTSGETDLIVEDGDTYIRHRFRFPTTSDRDAWHSALCAANTATYTRVTRGGSAGTLLRKATSSGNILTRTASAGSLLSTAQLPALPAMRISTNARLIGIIDVLAAVNGWIARLAVLDEEAVLHFHIPDMQKYASERRMPLESFDLTVALSARYSEGSDGVHLVTLSTAKRPLHFRTRTRLEAENWVDQIQRLVKEKLPESTIADNVFEGTVQVTKGGAQLAPGGYWLQVVHGALYYLPTQMACLYSSVVGQITDVHAVDSTTFSVSGLEHQVFSTVAHTAWVARLSAERLKTFDVLAAAGLSHAEFDHLLADGKWWAMGEDITWIDESAVEKGQADVMYMITGKVRLSVQTVATKWTNLRSDAAFVLDHGSEIYHWSGSASSRVCRARAMDLAARLRKARGMRPQVHPVDEQSGRNVFIAFKSLLTTESDPPTPTPSTSIAQIPTIRIFCTTRGAKLMSLRYEGMTPSKQVLDSETATILASGEDVFVWHGSKSTHTDRASAGIIGRGIARKIGHAFDKFVDYEGSLPISLRPAALATMAAVPSPPVAAVTIAIPRSAPIPPPHPPLPPGGTLTTTLTTSFTPTLQATTGVLYTEETYVFEYSYRLASGRTRHAVFYWIGAGSGATGGGTGAMLAVEAARAGDGDSEIVRIVEGKGA
ncbi:Coronin-2B [Geranomyces variabilis]|uniref:Coronin-2B n=1 Tax=Geranomyces variabilis TaxID=109894 RepID=A0AAD5TKA0_9FUNG|nr:Coronin-2B [Geranomyces variabilis]